MGQRHQLFIIAKIGSRYRSLAAVHHQSLQDVQTVETCLRILVTLGNPANRRGIRHELANAATKPDAFWEDAEASWKSQFDSLFVPFPFIMTCLVIAASFVVEPPYNYPRISPEPLGMPFDGGDNNDGITVIDVTQPENLRYCFVFVDGSELGRRRNTPLSERLYRREYERQQREDYLEVLNSFRGRFEDEDDNDNMAPYPSGQLAVFEVLGIDCLKSAWPEGGWTDYGYVQTRRPKFLRL